MKAISRRALACATLAALAAAPAASADVVEPPMALPGDAAAASAGAAAPGTWIVGARPGAPARALAQRFGAEWLGEGGYVLSRSRARAFAAALERRGLLVYAQPDTYAEPLQRAVGQDPLSVPPDAWRDVVADPALAPPAVTPESPLIALIDAQLDATHPEFAGGNTTTVPTFGVTNSHGTATASVAAAPINGVGIVGVWPGARAVNLPLPEDIRCSDSARQIRAAVKAGAAVINMSYGATSPCFPEYVALQRAVAAGIVPVAAAGNEFAEGNPPEFPASLPHVVTVAAVGPDLRSSAFSNTGPAIDLSAPGVNIMTAVPPGLDADGTPDGWERQSGTSFSAPMVSAALAWVRAARPDLTPDQVAQAVRLSAQDPEGDGWQPDTGFGVLSVGAALAFAPPPPDPSEPNDDIVWVDGRALGKPNPLIYRGGKATVVSALLDAFEDPADVYRIRVKPRRRAQISANPGGNDDVALYAFPRKAKRVSSRPLTRSAKRGKRTERITLRNRGSRAKTYYVAVEVQPGARDLDASYRLRVG